MRLRFLKVFFLLSLFCGAQHKITSVSFEGTKNTKVSFLEKMTRVKVGMVVDSFALETDINQLKKLPSIANATYKIDLKAENTCTIIYTVTENFTLIPFANVYTSSNDEFAFRVGLQEFNLLGRNMIVGAFFQRDIFNSFGLNFRAPYLFSNKTGIAISFNDLITQEPIFFDGGTADYKYHNKSFEVLGLYKFNTQNNIDFGVNFFTEKYNYLTGDTNPSVPQTLDVNKMLYKLIYKYDNVNYFYQYLSGFKSTLNLQYVHSSNKNLKDFSLFFNDFNYYRRIGKRGNWANRLRIGLASNDETPFAPFSVDNNINIRGVGNVIDRGTGTIVLNTEYRHSFIDSDKFAIQGNFFIDGGTWRHPGGGFDDFVNSDNIRVYPGLGLRFIHKRIFNAIFRIDYGYGITKYASKGIVFGIGQYF